MAGTETPSAERVAGGAFLHSLDLPAAAAAEEARGASPGMLRSAERAMLSEIVRRTWRGAGAIVDGGSFLGSSLVAEAEGLEAGGALAQSTLAHFPAGKPIHGYELGHHPVPPRRGAALRRNYAGLEYVLGESFVPVLEANIADHRDLIELHIGDLVQMDWDGSPVEIAFLDVCKTSELNAHVSRQFYPALIAGQATLIHQDFFFDQLPWIRVTMGYLADYFRWEGQVASSSIYTTVRAVPEEAASYDPFTQGTLEECLAHHDAVSFPGIDRTARLMLDLSRVVLMLTKGAPERALDLLEDVAVEYVDLLGVASMVSSYRPLPGTSETMEPRYRMDRVVSQVLSATVRKRGTTTEPRRPTPPGPPGPVDDARDALARGDLDAARRILAPLAADESRGAAALLLARTELESGHLDLAATRLDALLARRPRQGRARALRARVHLVAGDETSARAEADEALRLDPGSTMARSVLFDLGVAERLRADASAPQPQGTRSSAPPS